MLPGVREVMEVRDNLAAIGRHACPGFDCAVCQSSRNTAVLDDALAAINAPTSAVDMAKVREGWAEETQRLEARLAAATALLSRAAKLIEQDDWLGDCDAWGSAPIKGERP